MTGKRHSDLLDSIKGYVKHLTDGNFRSLDVFINSTYI
jgi:phage regulator Rha-like protein